MHKPTILEELTAISSAIKYFRNYVYGNQDVEYIEGKDNFCADALIRININYFKELNTDLSDISSYTVNDAKIRIENRTKQNH